MYKLIPNEDGIVKINEKTSTTLNDINRIFGHFLPSENRKLTKDEYESIVAFCMENSWKLWESTWEKWRNNEQV